jgi:hypothetical protein
MKIRIKTQEGNKWQRIEVKQYSELTLAEYRKIMDVLSVKGEISLIDYISIITNNSYKSVMGAEIRGDHKLKMLGHIYFVAGLGEKKKNLYYIEDLHVHKIFRYKRKLYDFNQINERARGYRILLNEFMKTNPTIIDIYTFCLAMMLENEFDYKSVIRIKEDLENYSYTKVLTLGGFFFFNITHGKSRVIKGLLMLTRKYLTNILTLKSKQE